MPSTESATEVVLYKKMFLKISQISQEKHLCWSVFLIKLQTCGQKRVFFKILQISQENKYDLLFSLSKM